MVKLDQDEKKLVTAAIKSLYSTATDETEQRVYADLYLRIEEQDFLDKDCIKFLTILCDKVVKKVDKVTSSGVITNEALLRAEVVKELFAGIQRKVVVANNGESTTK